MEDVLKGLMGSLESLVESRPVIGPLVKVARPIIESLVSVVRPLLASLIGILRSLIEPLIKGRTLLEPLAKGLMDLVESLIGPTSA